jgi:hypothetical protein
MLQSCGNVIQEDATQEEPGLTFSANNGITQVAVTTRRAVLSIRPLATVGPSSKVNRIPIIPEAFTLLVGTNDCLWEIVHDPTFTGTPVWTSADAQSGVEYSIHADAALGAITNGHVVESGYQGAGAGAVRIGIVQAGLLNKLPITLDMSGANPQAFSIVCTSRTGTSNVLSSLTWKEIR